MTLQVSRVQSLGVSWLAALESLTWGSRHSKNLNGETKRTWDHGLVEDTCIHLTWWNDGKRAA